MHDLPTYTPPRVLRGGHRQTVLPSLFRRVEGVVYDRERLELEDGDFLDLDWLRQDGHRGAEGRRDGASLVLIAHGLEGSSDRAYVRGLARALHRRGWDVCAWNLRGCSGEPNRLLRTYHSGVSDDLDAVVHHALAGGYGRVAVAGFSLGGNVTLKWLGEQSEAIDPRIVAGVGISVPVDLAGSARVMNAVSRRPYMLRFLRSLAEKVTEKATRFPDALDASSVHEMRTFAEFDGHFTAPMHGFESAEDYWARASSGPLLGAIRVPTLLIQALDDPFLSASCYPVEAAAQNPDLHLLLPQWGGHVGFMARGGEFWSEAVAGHFLDTVRSE